MIRAVLLGCALFAVAYCLEDAALSTNVATAEDAPSLMSLLSRRKRDLYDYYGNGMGMGMMNPMMGRGMMSPMGMRMGMMNPYQMGMGGMGMRGMSRMGMMGMRPMGMGYPMGMNMGMGGMGYNPAMMGMYGNGGFDGNDNFGNFGGGGFDMPDFNGGGGDFNGGGMDFP